MWGADSITVTFRVPAQAGRPVVSSASPTATPGSGTPGSGTPRASPTPSAAISHPTARPATSPGSVVPTQTTSAQPPAPLVFTGFDLVPVVLIGLLLVFVGTLLLISAPLARHGRPHMS
jgi:hypothetical protein